MAWLAGNRGVFLCAEANAPIPAPMAFHYAPPGRRALPNAAQDDHHPLADGIRAGAEFVMPNMV
jgi:hypothetical protein